MRLGLLADVHEQLENLAAAIARCRREGADRLLLLGDVFETGARFGQTVALLRECGVAGVWGNHDFGICHEPDQTIRDRFVGPILDYMSRLQPRMEVDGVLLSHVLPCLEPTDLTQPWYVERFPETAEAAAPNFAAFPHRRMFVGHYHYWRIATPRGALPWAGERSFYFDKNQRYLVAVAAVHEGFCAVYDTEADWLLPCGPTQKGNP